MSFLNPFGRRKQQQEELTRLVLDYILAPDEQVEAFLESHADALLSDAAEKIFERLLNEAGDDEDTSLLIRDRHNRLMRILVDEMPELIPAWVETQNDLAAEYLARADESTDNWCKAIEKYEEALEVLDPFNHPDEWGTTCSNLAQAYQTMELPGDRGILDWALKDEAIEYFISALFGWTRDRFPQQWAKVQLKLGLTYLARRRGNRWDNLEAAIAHFQYAGEILTREEAPVDWAYLQAGLGLAYKEQAPEDIERAIDHFQNALIVSTRAADPEKWALLQYYLGSAYLERKQGDRADNIERAIHHLHQALEVQQRATDLEGWTLSQTSLGMTYADRVRGVRAENIQLAIAAYHRVLQGQELEDRPDLHLMVQDRLGDLYFTEGRWNEAQQAYQTALAAQELLYRAGASIEERHSWLRTYNDIQVNTAYCLARLGHFNDAVEAVEKGKARTLGETLAHREAALEMARPQDRAAFLAARERLTELEAQARSEDQIGSDELRMRDEICQARDHETMRRIWERMQAETDNKEAEMRPSELHISTELRKAQAELEDVVARIQSYAPEFINLRLDFAGIAALAKDLAYPLVYLLTTTAGSLALIVEPGTKALTHQHAVWLDDFKDDDLSQILHYQQEDQPYYLGCIGGEEHGGAALIQVLDRIWPVLEGRLMKPIVQRLLQLGYSRAILLPSLSLGLLPLPAAAFDQMILTYAPSARSLQMLLKNAWTRAGKAPVLLGIGNPHNAQKPLPFARIEVEESAVFFPTSARRCFYECQATRAAVIQALPGATHLHFACHGNFDLGYELDSALFLAGEDRLTLRDLLDGALGLSSARLAVLSACQTGLTDIIKVPEEAMGFPAGFLQAGVPGVVSTLWPVADISTALLLTQFYRYHIQDGLDPAIALHNAQAWLRTATAQDMGLADYYQRVYQESGQRDADAFRAMRYYRANPQVRPFAHPYYWAAFVFSGIGV